MMDSTSQAYSSGLPSRDGFGIVLAKNILTFSGRDDSSGVSKRPRQYTEDTYIL